jgi:hypothetical protein
MNNKKIKVMVGLLVSMLVLSVTLTFSVLLPFPSIAAYAATVDNSVKMTKQQSFIDSHGRLNIIGVVNNNGNVPVSVTVGLNTIGESAVTNTMTDPTYGNIIYPLLARHLNL